MVGLDGEWLVVLHWVGTLEGSPLVLAGCFRAVLSNKEMALNNLNRFIKNVRSKDDYLYYL